MSINFGHFCSLDLNITKYLNYPLVLQLGLQCTFYLVASYRFYVFEDFKEKFHYFKISPPISEHLPLPNKTIKSKEWYKQTILGCEILG